MSIITTNDGKYYKKPNIITVSNAVMSGYAAQGITTIPLYFLSKSVVKKMSSYNSGIDTIAISHGITDALKFSGLKDKGVKLFKFNPKNILSESEILNNFIEKLNQISTRPINPNKPLKLSKLFNNFTTGLIKHGYNACFVSETNAVYININKLGTSAFHEIGHAINFNSSKFWKFMQKLRLPLMILTAVIPVITVFKRKKVEGEETKNILDKTMTVIKENAGKLTSLMFLPIVAEELKASARGNKLAKMFLTKDLANKVIKTNKYGAITYIANCIAVGFTAYIANAVKDKLAKPKLVSSCNPK